MQQTKTLRNHTKNLNFDRQHTCQRHTYCCEKTTRHCATKCTAGRKLLLRAHTHSTPTAACGCPLQHCEAPGTERWPKSVFGLAAQLAGKAKGPKMLPRKIAKISKICCVRPLNLNNDDSGAWASQKNKKRLPPLSMASSKRIGPHWDQEVF